MHDIEEIYRKYADDVFKYLFSITRNYNIAEELTQETFYQAIRSINNFKGECKLLTWLCQIAKHVWFQYLNKEMKRELIDIDSIDLKDLVNIEQEMLIQETKIELFKQINNLPDETKEVMLMRLTGELSFKEIGEILNKSENWARVTYYRGKKKLEWEKI